MVDKKGLEHFLRHLLSMEAHRVPGSIFRREVVVDVEEVVICLA